MQNIGFSGASTIIFDLSWDFHWKLIRHPTTVGRRQQPWQYIPFPWFWTFSLCASNEGSQARISMHVHLRMQGRTGCYTKSSVIDSVSLGEGAIKYSRKLTLKSSLILTFNNVDNYFALFEMRQWFQYFFLEQWYEKLHEKLVCIVLYSWWKIFLWGWFFFVSIKERTICFT